MRLGHIYENVLWDYVIDIVFSELGDRFKDRGYKPSKWYPSYYDYYGGYYDDDGSGYSRARFIDLLEKNVQHDLSKSMQKLLDDVDDYVNLIVNTIDNNIVD